MDNAKICKKDSDKSFKLLFVGGYFWPNIHGITWFVNNVMSELPDDVFLIVVGNNMEKLKNDLSKDNIIIHGRVDCLDDFYWAYFRGGRNENQNLRGINVWEIVSGNR